MSPARSGSTGLLPLRRMLALVGAAAAAAGILVADTAGATAAGATAADDRPTAIVSLGDSAISGEGAGDYEAGTDGPQDYCHRSLNALIHETAIPGVRTTINLACSGAATSDIRIGGTSHYTEPSQADQLRTLARQYDVKMLVLEVGANDDPAFSDTVLACVQAWLNPFSAGCRDTVGASWPDRVAAMAPKVEAVVDDLRTVMREDGYADDSYQFVLQSYASPVTENMAWYHAFQGCPFRTDDARWGRTTAVPLLAEALRGVADRTGVRFLDLARATEGHEACTRASSQWWITPLVVDYGQILVSGITSHIVQQSFHPNALGHAQMGHCLTEFAALTVRTGSCLRGADGNLHAAAAAATAAVG
jgi:lysophospholipase L1-like esterase